MAYVRPESPPPSVALVLPPTPQEVDEMLATIAWPMNGEVIDKPRNLDHWRKVREMGDRAQQDQDNYDRFGWVQPAQDVVYTPGPKSVGFIRWYRKRTPRMRLVAIAYLRGVSRADLIDRREAAAHDIWRICGDVDSFGPKDWTADDWEIVVSQMERIHS